MKIHLAHVSAAERLRNWFKDVDVYQVIELSTLASYSYFVCRQQKCVSLSKKGNVAEAVGWVTDSEI